MNRAKNKLLLSLLLGLLYVSGCGGGGGGNDVVVVPPGASLVIRAWAAIPLGFGLYLAWAVLA